MYLDTTYLDVKIVEMDSSGIHLWLVLMKAYRTLARYARCSIELSGLGPSDFAILELLLHRGQHPVNTIGRRVDLTSGAITSAVDRLEAQGLVVRTPDPEDRRTRFVSLTPKGTARIREVFGAHKQTMEGVTSSLTKAERETLINLIKKLGRGAEGQLAKRGEE
jgi:MarR family transcriptional regulator, 2-MHQ and catechol-resistance regulon repressor